MPYETIDEGIGLVFRFRGEVITKELMAANTEGWEHPKWQTHRYQIWDFSNVENMIADETDAHVIAKMDNVAFKITRAMKAALVANSEDIINLLEHYLASLEVENMEARIFGDEVTARQWVDG